jgi:hypothetical protein
MLDCVLLKKQSVCAAVMGRTDQASLEAQKAMDEIRICLAAEQTNSRCYVNDLAIESMVVPAAEPGMLQNESLTGGRKARHSVAMELVVLEGSMTPPSRRPPSKS